MVLNNENLQKLEEEKKAEDEERNAQIKKVVGFKMIEDENQDDSKKREFVDTGSNDDQQDERIKTDDVKIPKRGSSRGSSCTEEVIHQTTINLLGDLFP